MVEEGGEVMERKRGEKGFVRARSVSRRTILSEQKQQA